MKVQKVTTESHQKVSKSDTANSKSKLDKSDPFSKILDEKRKEFMPGLNLPAQDQVLESPLAAPDSEHVSGGPLAPDIEGLASEIVEHISSHQTDGASAIEIQFSSRTLDGLRVNVIGQQGSVAVSFVTSVPWVAGVVQRNLSDLRSSLESKGIRVTQLAVRRRTG